MEEKHMEGKKNMESKMNIGRSLTAILFAMMMIASSLAIVLTSNAGPGDDYHVYSNFNPPGISDVTGAGGYVEDYGVPETWGDEIQFIYFLSGTMGYKVKVWVTNEGSPDDPTSYIDIRQHPDHPTNPGPIEPRHFEIVSSADLSAYVAGSGPHTEEFYIDSSGVYVGAYPNGIHKWDHSWNYIGKIANSPTSRTESIAYNSGDNVWYAGGRSRTIYQLSDTDDDGSFMDESWVGIFTYPSYAGSHHDGMEYIGGYLWISDMTSDLIGKWQYDIDTSTWVEVEQYTYTEAAYVEGMGFGPNDHFWVGSGWGSNSYAYELGNEISMYYPIADAGEDVPFYPPTIPLAFDGSGSHHTDPAREIVQYEWDFDGDGVYDYSGTNPVAYHAYPAYYNPDSSIDWYATAQTYTAVLRVTDDDPVTPKTDIDTRNVDITPPPWSPVADPNGPYNTRVNHEVCLDGSGSFHPAAEIYDPGDPWYDEIEFWDWDLDNDGEFDDATGETVCTQWSTEGTYFIGLRVTDLYPTPGDPEMDVDEKYTTVVVGAIHDVAVVSVIPSESVVYVGEGVIIDVIVSNLGDYTESFDVTVSYDSELIGVESVTNLDPGQDKALQFSWDTTGVPEGEYTIEARADIVPGEYIVDNNILESNILLICTIPPVAVAGGSYEDTDCNDDYTIDFDGSSSSGYEMPLTYDWDFGDGTGWRNDIGATPSYTYSNFGEYIVTLRVTDNDGLTDTDSTTATIYGAFADAGGPYEDTDCDDDYTIDFDGSSSSGYEMPLTYDWDFGDGTGWHNDIGATPSYTYSNFGEYTVSLRVTESGNGCSDTDSAAVEIYGVDADAGGPYDNSMDCSYIITFAGSGTGYAMPLTYDWDFGDGTGWHNDIGATPSYTYSNFGEYIVTLRVTDNDETTATDSTTATIYGAFADAGGPYEDTDCDDDYTIDFDGSSSSGYEMPLTYDWDFGDGTGWHNDIGATPSYTYSNFGEYTVTLTVTDGGGHCSDIDTTTATIYGAIADANGPYDNTADCSYTITFDGSGSSGYEMPLTYDWDFDDGSAHGTGVSPTHTYSNFGEYTVTLTVTDGGGHCSDIDTTTATIYGAIADANGPYDNTADCSYTITFDGSGSSGYEMPLTYDWDFDDGSTHGTGVSPTHTYSNFGEYTVTSTVTDGGGHCSDIDTTTATIYGAIADANGPYTAQFGDYTVEFDGSGSTGYELPLTYDWDFGDGSAHGAGVNPTHTYYPLDHTYEVTVTLTVTESNGCSDADTAIVTVYPGEATPPIVQLISPEDGDTVSGTVAVEWYAIDDDHPGESLPMYLYYKPVGVDSWHKIAGPIDNTGEYNWNTGSLADGQYVLIVEAVGSGGMASDSATITVSSGNAGMMVDVQVRDSNTGSTSWVKDGDTVEITAAITGTGASSLVAEDITADLSGFGKGTVVAASYDGFEATWTINNVVCTPADGSITVVVDANGITTGSATITADNTNPEVTIDKPVNGLYFFNTRLLPLSRTIIIGAITIELDTDDNNGIDRAEFYIDGDLKETDTGGSFEWYTKLPRGQHRLEVRVYDHAGNKATQSVDILKFL